MSWLHQDYTQPVLFLQPETFKIEDAAKDAATVLTLKPERMECSTGHHLKKGKGRLMMSRPDSILSRLPTEVLLCPKLYALFSRTEDP